MDDPVVIIAGPTGSGKSRLALDVAREFTGTVINADSMQVYGDFSVLTARPGDEEERKAPHRLFGVLAADDVCSAGRWLGMATAEIEAAHGAGRLPVLVGGTGLYLKALTDGLAEVPDVPDEINAEVRGLYDRLGGEAFRAELAKEDPDAAARLPAGDGQRLKRAMAVIRATGRPLAHWQREQAEGPAVAARFATIALAPGREALYAACDARFDGMMARGALDEVKAAIDRGRDPELPAMKALGVPELRRHLAGESTFEEACAAAKQATRNFAKRQLTWLRNQVEADCLIAAAYSPTARDRALAFVGDFLARG
ncbi:MAG: tRNA (adenosine(37)-N6)-dimethylallyltransferase MiaA [Rhodospirillales bacterium]